MHEAQRYPKVLVVEDDGAIRALLVRALRLHSLGVDEAADGLEAARLARDNDYAVMLVDFMMPGMSGPEFLGHVREARPATSTVILMMTAADEDILRGSASDLAHGFVRKPFDIVDLVQTVSDIAIEAENSRPAIPRSKNEPWLAC